MKKESKRTRAQVMKILAKKNGMTVKEIERAIDGTIELMKTEELEVEDVLINDFRGIEAYLPILMNW